MRINTPKLPEPEPKIGTWSTTLLHALKRFFDSLTGQVNGISEGRIASVTNAYTEPPVAGTYAQGDFVRNSAPAELGTEGAKYVVTGWVCVEAGSPGTWVEQRTLTGA
jgi:hypothetical protein